MEFDIVKKYTAEMDHIETYLLSTLVNTCFYKKTVPNKTVEEIFFSDPKLLNFIIEDQGEKIGLFQSKDLPKIESAYIFSVSVRPDYRGRGIAKEMIDKKVDYYKSKSRKYIGTRSMNPSIIEVFVKKGFFLPETKNEELLGKAKEILYEIEGSSMGIGDDFVIPRKHTVKYPNSVDVGECRDSKIADFINTHMDAKNGDRLFLARKL